MLLSEFIFNNIVHCIIDKSTKKSDLIDETKKEEEVLENLVICCIVDCRPSLFTLHHMVIREES